MDVNRRTVTPPNADNHPEQSPVTPRRVLDRSTGGTDGKPQLQSTPSNRGSASCAEYLHDTRYGLHICLYGVFIIIHSDKSISPPIIADLKHHKDECTVENLLNGMLSRCLPKEGKRNLAPNVLDLCLEAVLPICNDETTGMGLRDYLTK
jgi:hypothetical protein